MNFECFSRPNKVIDRARSFAMNANYSAENHTSDYRRNERQEMLIAPPLDLSFRKASTMDGIYKNRRKKEKCHFFILFFYQYKL